MDKRYKARDRDAELKLVEEFYQKFAEGRLSISEATKAMRRISGLTQPEFARNRQISLPTLRKIETEAGSVNVDTLNKIGHIFGLEIGFVRKAKEK